MPCSKPKVGPLLYQGACGFYLNRVAQLRDRRTIQFCTALATTLTVYGYWKRTWLDEEGNKKWKER